MDSTGEKDWDALVDEMEQIRGRVEQALDSSPDSGNSGPAPAASSEYASMDEMLAGLGREEIDGDTKKGFSGNVVQLEPVKKQDSSNTSSSAAPESALNLAVVGALKLRLELTREAQTVQIHLEESQLRVELSDGTQFRIPLNKAA
jgi:hypothetical protein